jgi:iron(III) transport system substrate-binding protein
VASPSAKPAAVGQTSGAGPTVRTAIGTTEAQLLEGAKRDGKLVIYTNQNPDQADKTIAQVTSRLGFAPTLERLTTQTLAQRYSAEAEAGRFVADLVVVGGQEFQDLGMEKGWWADLGNDMPSLVDWPAQFWSPKYATVGFISLGLIHNSQRVTAADAPKTLQDLLNPRWKDQIIMVDPHSAGGPDYWLYVMRKAYGDGFIRDFGRQNPKLQASSPVVTQSVAAGAGLLGVPIGAGAIVQLVAQGAPLAHTVIGPTSGGVTWAYISAKAPNQAAAKWMLNYYMTKDGQETLNAGGHSPLPGVANATPLPPGYEAPNQKASRDQLPEVFNLMGMVY